MTTRSRAANNAWRIANGTARPTTIRRHSLLARPPHAERELRCRLFFAREALPCLALLRRGHAGGDRHRSRLLEPDLSDVASDHVAGDVRMIRHIAGRAPRPTKVSIGKARVESGATRVLVRVTRRLIAVVGLLVAMIRLGDDRTHPGRQTRSYEDRSQKRSLFHLVHPQPVSPQSTHQPHATRPPPCSRMSTHLSPIPIFGCGMAARENADLPEWAPKTRANYE
jgi:hypothetical protein